MCRHNSNLYQRLDADTAQTNSPGRTVISSDSCRKSTDVIADILNGMCGHCHLFACTCQRACQCACVRACVYACVRACVRWCLYVRAFVFANSLTYDRHTWSRSSGWNLCLRPSRTRLAPLNFSLSAAPMSRNLAIVRQQILMEHDPDTP